MTEYKPYLDPDHPNYAWKLWACFKICVHLWGNENNQQLSPTDIENEVKKWLTERKEVKKLLREWNVRAGRKTISDISLIVMPDSIKKKYGIEY